MRRIHLVLIAIILVKGALIWWTLNPNYHPSVPMSGEMQNFLAILVLLRFENMALGGLGAYILFHRRRVILHIMYHPITQIAALLAVIGAIYYWQESLSNYREFLLAVPFIVIILNVASNSRSLLKLENRVLDRLGRISYGIYMYHVIVMGVVLSFLMKFAPFQPNGQDFGQNILIYGLTISLSLLTAHLSYEYFEKFFLRFKTRFSTVRSID